MSPPSSRDRDVADRRAFPREGASDRRVPPRGTAADRRNGGALGEAGEEVSPELTDGDTGERDGGGTRSDRPEGRSERRTASSRSTRLSRTALGLGLLLVLSFAWLAFGGVHHGSRAILHGSLALLLACAALMPARSLRHAGKVVPLGMAGGLLLLPALIGLLPLPTVLRAWVAPANVAIRPDVAWWTLSLDPELTLGELGDLLLPAGAMLLAATWGAAWWRRSEVERVMRCGLVGVLVVGAAHGFSGATALFGVFQSSVRPPQKFFAPFIDPNHLGSAIVLLLPSVLAVAADRGASRTVRIGWAGVAAAAAGLLVAIGSSGSVFAAAAVVVLTAWRTGWVSGARLAALVALAALFAVPWLWVGDPNSGVTMAGRVEIWRASLETVPGWWLAGSGGGTFEAAIQPKVTSFDGWTHAHNELVEWLLEYGLAGVLVWVPSAWLLRPRPSLWPERADVLVIGVVGVLVHALVDFPLQIPALAMGAGAMWGIRRAAYEPRIEVRVAVVRGILAAVAVLQILACAWELRAVEVRRAVVAVHTLGAGAVGAEATLARLAPRSPELGMLRTWDVEHRQSPAAAVAAARELAADHPDDPRALRVAARVLARGGATDEAMSTYDRAIARFPGDWHTWVSRAIDTPKDRAFEAWKGAFEAGAPPKYLPMAWASMPVGLVWLDVAASREARFSANVGAFLHTRGDTETAALAYEQAYLVDPQELPHPGYVRVLLALGRNADAERFVANALHVRPDDRRLQQQHAELLEAQGRYDDAADVWMALSEKSPALMVQAMQAVEKGSTPADAVRLVERWALTRTLDPAVVLERARLRRDLGDFGACAADVISSGLLDDRRYGARARSLLESCEAVHRRPPAPR